MVWELLSVSVESGVFTLFYVCTLLADKTRCLNVMVIALSTRIIGHMAMSHLPSQKVRQPG